MMEYPFVAVMTNDGLLMFEGDNWIANANIFGNGIKVFEGSQMTGEARTWRWVILISDDETWAVTQANVTTRRIPRDAQTNEDNEANEAIEAIPDTLVPQG